MSKDVDLRVRCSAAWKERLRAAAEADDREMSDIIREAVNQWLDRRNRRLRYRDESDQASTG